MTARRWQDWLLLVGGLWVFVAPWALSSAGAWSWTGWITGALMVGTATWALVRPADRATDRLEGVYGVWLFLAPWILGFSAPTGVAWTAWIVGAATVALAGGALSRAGSVAAQPVVDEHVEHVVHARR